MSHSCNARLQHLLDELLWDIYGKVSVRQREEDDVNRSYLYTDDGFLHICPNSWKYPVRVLQEQTIESLTQISASLRLEVRIIGYYLSRVLMKRDRKRRRHEMLCDVVTACLHAFSDKSAEAKEMKFTLSPPSPPKIDAAKNIAAASSDFNQWLHAMKMVARLPGGMPPEFRKKLWLSLADRYLQTKNVDWDKEQTKCFSEQWREDDEELGIQIVKDLHRTGSSLCSGPAGSLNQAKLKRVLLGYARWNPEVGYCQGFNMLGALILQVMDKNEEDSMKVMIFLVEGLLPAGYFSGSLGGLQADMAVFRELMTSKLPRLAKHLQRLQGPMGEGSFEPPLTNVFTMQWFLTLFCTCLPMNCVLRVWDLILIEGSDVLLRTALAIWSLLEEKILATKTADDFYCRMGTLSGELLNGHLIDSNGLIEKVVELGPISDLQKLREKHLYNIAPWQDKKGLKIFYSDDEADSDEDSRLAVATVWGLRLNRRGSSSTPNKPPADNKDRIALDISLLKKQYDRLRERQRQAHIILTAAVVKQGTTTIANPPPPLQMNQLLMGRNAILTNKGRRIGPPQGAIPPARKVNTITNKASRQSLPKPGKRGETLHWQDTDAAKRRKSSITIKPGGPSESSVPTRAAPKLYSDVGTSSKNNVSDKTSLAPTQKIRKKSESSSYSEDSDANSSTSTSLCDDDDIDMGASSLEASPLKKQEANSKTVRLASGENEKENGNDNVNKVPEVVLINLDKEVKEERTNVPGHEESTSVDNSSKFPENGDEDSSAECDRNQLAETGQSKQPVISGDETASSVFNNLVTSSASHIQTDNSTCETSVECQQVQPQCPTELANITSLSPISDIKSYISTFSISPPKSPRSNIGLSSLLSSKKNEEATFNDTDDSYDASEEGVTNQYFERVNLVERPKNLNLYYSHSDLSPIAPEHNPSTSGINKTHSDRGSLQLSANDDKKPCDQAEVIGIHEKSPPYNASNVSSTDRSKQSFSDATSPKPSSPSSRSKHVVMNPSHLHIDREKSFSFDDASTVKKEEPRPSSCPEARADIAEGKSRSDNVLRIIEENSKILNRILKKHTSGDTAKKDENEKDYDRTSSKDAHVNEKKLTCKPTTSTDEVEHTNLSKDYLGDVKAKSSACKSNSSTRSAIDNNSSPEGSDKPKSDASHRKSYYLTKIERSRPSSRSRPKVEVPFRNDDNITDRLESIKKTIKSIDTLCDDRASYKTIKCQKYIDSLFEKKTKTKPVIHVSEASSDYNYNDEYIRSERSVSSARYSRDVRRDTSPRRRLAEDREEYESRASRDILPICSNSFSENQDSSVERTSRNNNKSPCWWDHPTTLGEKDDISLSAGSTYTPNKIEIRHTTVTSTMYDRYLYQKKERNAKGEKSPPSPVITKAYLDSLRPNAPATANRYARSAENSPSREKVYSSKSSISPCITSPSEFKEDLQIRSCDNILMCLSSSSTLTTTTMQPYSSLSPKSYPTSLITIKPYRGPLDRPDTST